MPALIRRTALLVLLAGFPTFAKAQSTSPRVDSLKVHLYYPSLGTFDTTDLASPDANFGLWNVIIGAGDAAAPSSAIFVRVHVAGTLAARADRFRVGIMVRADLDLLLGRHIPLDEFRSAGSDGVWIPLIVPGTGCRPVRISAVVSRVDGQETAPSVTRTIPFRCGE